MNAETLLLIKQRIANIQYGLLRFHDKNAQVNLPVKVTVNEDASLNCIVINGHAGGKFINKNVNLIQKYHDDYLHITGKVSAEIQKNSRILSFEIVRLCWFVRESKGCVSWLRQKYLYDPFEERNDADIRA
jgi:hypothetical protein